MKSLQESIKVKLFKEWLPDKEGGLTGLIVLAAKVAAEVVEERVEEVTLVLESVESLKEKVEDLTERLHFAEAGMVKEEGESEGEDEGRERGEGTPVTGSADLTQYNCPSCGHSHKVDSRIGKEHMPAYLREQVEANVELVTPNDLAGRGRG